MKLAQGSIIKASVLDPQSRNRKERPLVLLTPTLIIPQAPVLVAVAITSTLRDPLPDTYVLLPWHNARHPVTGLNRKCAAVCDWRTELKPEDILAVTGRCPSRELGEILTKVGQHP